MNVRRIFVALLVVILFASQPGIAAADQKQKRKKPEAASIGLQVVASGFERPIYVISDPGNAKRLFVVEQTGRIFIVDNGVRLKQPLLDISDQVVYGGEKGLFSMAFDPKFAKNGRIYVYYYALDDHVVISRFKITKKRANVVQPGNEKIILHIEEPYENHNGGQLQFGPDGYLYIGMGDGGSGGDPQNFAQSLNTNLGKMLRLDVRRLPAKNPPDNPFIGRADTVYAIWAYGLRNPWRFSFDRLTGDLWIGDVGQNWIEEVDFQPASDTGGRNYGWRMMEGTDCYDPDSGCDQSGKVLPIHEYTHDVGASITGGYVYRGTAIPALQGHYFFGDFIAGRIWSFKYAKGVKSEFTDWTDVLKQPDGSSVHPSSFGEDADGELYICEFYSGRILKIMAK